MTQIHSTLFKDIHVLHLIGKVCDFFHRCTYIYQNFYFLQLYHLGEVARAVGVLDQGTKTDIIVRLKDKLRNTSVFKKVFTKVWGASGT